MAQRSLSRSGRARPPTRGCSANGFRTPNCGRGSVLTAAEVEKLTEAAKGNRYGHRDASMILVAYRHGLRVSELVDLGVRSTSAAPSCTSAGPSGARQAVIPFDESRALQRLQREHDPKSPFVFTSERGSPFTTAGFARMVERAGVEAKLGFKVHPHMLRHACGFALAGKGTIGVLSRLILDTAISSTRSDIPSCRPIGSRTSDGNRAISELVRDALPVLDLDPVVAPAAALKGHLLQASGRPAGRNQGHFV